MFIIGLEFNAHMVRGKMRLAGLVSATSVTIPFLLGIGLIELTALKSHQRWHETIGGVVHARSIPLGQLALFVGAAMSVTAFPVLARILLDRGLHRTPLGALALACAAVDDVLAWSLLAIVTARARHGAVAVPALADHTAPASGKPSALRLPSSLGCSGSCDPSFGA